MDYKMIASDLSTPAVGRGTWLRFRLFYPQPLAEEKLRSRSSQEEFEIID